ncbi:hypothetical protein CERSUDRAFT_110176 [Gelatoporia subvermispora B]|uniref:Dihydroorotate dehydrogenase catalytic domain-containing protein n=1 Tax=Ceriporiopsis subvermispora (strain B) TaxID=914234 RepID=M2RAZ3_CERS8|nr:hypothetical protein CERSUDRAFT_110176 [Gelatoporia subvermispora B]
MNSSSRWASQPAELDVIYASPFAGACACRTSTLNGFVETADNTHAFLKPEGSVSSINSYGYSPQPLQYYIDYTRTILTTKGADGKMPAKPIFISITASDPQDLDEMVTRIQVLRTELRKFYESKPAGVVVDPSTLIAIEFNTSCPNIPNSPPPAYDIPRLSPFLEILRQAFRADNSLILGLKLPPYSDSTMPAEVVRELEKYSTLTQLPDRTPISPWAFLTCTNTLGNSFAPESQLIRPGGNVSNNGEGLQGGLGGDPIHFLALGNVRAFAQALNQSPDTAMHDVRIIGVGGVTSRAAADRMRDAGATVVACATLLGMKGVEALAELAPA